MTKKSIPRYQQSRQLGFSLIEVLVTIIIVAVGLLGLAGLQTKMVLAEMESYQRSQALILLRDMEARISTNRAEIANYVQSSPIGTGDNLDCSGTSLAIKDICEWSAALKGAAEKTLNTTVGAMVGARGCIESIPAVATNAVQITVVWQGLSETISPALLCAESLNAYGGDGYRRAISTTVVIGNLN